MKWMNEHSTGGVMQASKVHTSKYDVHSFFNDILSINWL